MVNYNYDLCRQCGAKLTRFLKGEATVDTTLGFPIASFNDGSPTLRCPTDDQFGTIRRVGHSMWMLERNDDLARATFIEYELAKIDKHREDIERRYRTIEALREGMEVV